MRRASFVAGACLVALLASGAALFVASGLPYPWRGDLTRRTSADLLRGRLPRLHCVYPMRFGTGIALSCSALARDSVHGVEVYVLDRAVTGVHHVWWRREGAGRALADSLVRAMAAEHGPALECAGGTAPNGGDSPRVTWSWGRCNGYAPGAVQVSAAAGVPLRRGGPVGWAVSLHEYDRPR